MNHAFWPKQFRPTPKTFKKYPKSFLSYLKDKALGSFDPFPSQNANVFYGRPLTSLVSVSKKTPNRFMTSITEHNHPFYFAPDFHTKFLTRKVINQNSIDENSIDLWRFLRKHVRDMFIRIPNLRIHNFLHKIFLVFF